MLGENGDPIGIRDCAIEGVGIGEDLVKGLDILDKAVMEAIKMDPLEFALNRASELFIDRMENVNRDEPMHEENLRSIDHALDAITRMYCRRAGMTYEEYVMRKFGAIASRAAEQTVHEEQKEGDL